MIFLPQLLSFKRIVENFRRTPHFLMKLSFSFAIFWEYNQLVPVPSSFGSFHAPEGGQIIMAASKHFDSGRNSHKWTRQPDP